MSIKEQAADSFKLICYQLVYIAVKCIPARRRQRRLLLIKTDEIGDYVLLRNQLSRVRSSAVYRGYRVTLVGNTDWRQLFEAYDAQAADELIWIDKLRFRRDLFYRFSLLLRVRRAGYSDAVNLIYSRSFRIDDLLVAVSTSSNNTAMRSAEEPCPRLERLLTPGGIYDRLVDAGPKDLFDAIRNTRFIDNLLDAANRETIERVPPHEVIALPVPTFPTRLEALPAAYFVIVPGAGNPKKWWPVEHFAAAARYVARRHGLMPVICGGRRDSDTTTALFIALKGAGMDLTARTSLPELAEILRGARCLISIDTGAVHLAAAVGCPVFGLFSGFHYGRFAPYPSTLAPHFFPIYPDEIEEKLAEDELISEAVPMGLMSTIAVDKVIRCIDKELPALLQAGKRRETQTH